MRWILLSFLPIFQKIKGGKNPKDVANFIALATFATSMGYALKSNKDSSESQSKLNKAFHEENLRREAAERKLEELHHQTHAELKQVHKKINSLDDFVKSSSSKANNLISNFNLSSIQEYLMNIFNFGLSFDLLEQLALYNSLCSMYYLSLLSSFFLSKYGNYLIDRFNLEIRYPRLSRYLKYRMIAQKYYFISISVLGVSTILINLGINLYVFY